MNQNSVTILNTRIDILKRCEADENLAKLCTNDKPQYIFTPNPEIIMQARHDEALQKILNDSSLNLADGTGLLWAAYFLSLPVAINHSIATIATIAQWIGTILLIPFTPKLFKKPIPERISGSDFIWDIAAFAAKNNLKLFLLGGAPTVAERCALKLQTDIVDLRIAGVHSGKAEETQKIIEAVRKVKADILLVAFGAPKQEKWLAENLTKTGCKLGTGLGGTFDFIAGVRRRAPVWVQRIGLEWLFRLLQEPTRIKRQMAIPKFMWLVLKEKLQNNSNITS